MTDEQKVEAATALLKGHNPKDWFKPTTSVKRNPTEWFVMHKNSSSIMEYFGSEAQAWYFFKTGIRM